MKAFVIIRETKRMKASFSLAFDLPILPRVGDYISVFRGEKKFHSEDVVVRKIWWHLAHPDATACTSSSNDVTGGIREVFIECDLALGPNPCNDWRSYTEAARNKGQSVKQFEIGVAVLEPALDPLDDEPGSSPVP